MATKAPPHIVHHQQRVSSSPRRTPSSTSPSPWSSKRYALGSAFGDSAGAGSGAGYGLSASASASGARSSSLNTPVSPMQRYDEDLFITTSWPSSTSISASPTRMRESTLAGALHSDDPTVRLAFHRMRALALDDSPTPDGDGADEGFVPSMLGPPLPKVPGAKATTTKVGTGTGTGPGVTTPPSATRTTPGPNPITTSVLGPPLGKVRMRVKTPPLQTLLPAPKAPMALVTPSSPSAPPKSQQVMPLTPRSAESSVIRRRRRRTDASDSGYSGSEEDSIPVPSWERVRRHGDSDSECDDDDDLGIPRKAYDYSDLHLPPSVEVRTLSPRPTIVSTPPETPRRRATAPSTPPRSRATMSASSSSKYHIPRSPGTPHLGRPAQLIRTPGSPMPRSPGCRSLSSLT